MDDSPEAYPVVIAPHCDGDDGNDDRDGFDLFDTSTLTADLLGPDQDLNDFEISASWRFKTSLVSTIH